MDFAFFEKLTKAEAEKYLDDFLEFGKRAHPEAATAAAAAGIQADLSVSSVVPVLRWLLGQCKTETLKEDPNVPEFIRRTEVYRKSLFEFDDQSKPLVMYGGYYLGQSFVFNIAGLKWSIGNPEIAQQNMPVVSGFNVTEMAPILIVENVFARIIREPSKIDDIAVAVKAWLERAPVI